MGTTTTYVCDSCGHVAPRWFGRCGECGAWNSAVDRGAGSPPGPAAAVVALDSAAASPRRATGELEVDRVVGGGFVPGSVVLLAGEPGIGKSTLVLQVLDRLVAGDARVLLAAGEESLEQIALRAARLGIDGARIRAAATTDLPRLLELAGAEGTEVLVVDSIQTLQDPAFEQQPGTLLQVRECAARLVAHAKSTGCIVVLVGHVNKDGGVAGPKTLEHLVDVVLSIDGDRTGTLRLLRSWKNRFGACDEVGVFTMTAAGLAPVPDPSQMLLGDRLRDVSGSAVFPSINGTRPMLTEVQALVAPATPPHVRRVALGIESRRLALFIGVLAKRVGVDLAGDDVFVAAAGGVEVKEPAADLGLCLALVSAARDVALDPDCVFVGEVGLAGEVRNVASIDRRLTEASRLGFKRALAPRGTRSPSAGLAVVEVADLASACSHALGVRRGTRARAS